MSIQNWIDVALDCGMACPTQTENDDDCEEYSKNHDLFVTNF